MSGLIWVQSFCKSYQQTTLVGNELNDIQAIKVIGLLNGFKLFFVFFKYIYHMTSGIEITLCINIDKALQYRLSGKDNVMKLHF